MTHGETIPQVAYTLAFLLGEKFGAENYAVWQRAAGVSKIVEVFCRLVTARRVDKQALKAFIAGWRASEHLAF